MSIESRGYRARTAYAGRTAASYDADRLRTRYARWKWRNELKAVQRLATRVSAGGAILDVPVGTGRAMPELAAYGARVFGADISTDMLELAEQRINAGSSTAFLVRAEAERLPFSDGTFDAVFCLRLLQHLPVHETELVLSELCRVARGPAFVWVPLRHPWAPVVRSIYRALFGGGRRKSDARSPADRCFPLSRRSFSELLQTLGLQLRKSHSVTWRGSQLRLAEIWPLSGE